MVEEVHHFFLLILALRVTSFSVLIQALEQFRKEEVDFLIATDVAARVSINSAVAFCFVIHDRINKGKGWGGVIWVAVAGCLILYK